VRFGLSSTARVGRPVLVTLNELVESGFSIAEMVKSLDQYA
jgi:hypothetical protein